MPAKLRNWRVIFIFVMIIMAFVLNSSAIPLSPSSPLLHFNITATSETSLAIFANKSGRAGDNSSEVNVTDKFNKKTLVHSNSHSKGLKSAF